MKLDKEFIDRYVRPYYEQPHRTYHDFSLVEEKLAFVEKENLNLTDAQKLALLFAHADYVPSAKHNRDRSAALMTLVAIAAGFGDAKAVADAKAFILEGEQRQSDSEQGWLLIDLDLLRFSVEPTLFAQQRKELRDEYAHLGDEEWIFVWRNFVKRIAERAQVYNSGLLDKALEERAQANLRAEIELLGEAAPATKEAETSVLH